MQFSTKLTVNGEEVLQSIEPGSIAWKKANSVFIPLGKNHSIAYFAMRKLQVKEFFNNPTRKNTIIWEQKNVLPAKLESKGWYFLRADPIDLAHRNNPNTAYLAQFVDARYFSNLSTECTETNFYNVLTTAWGEVNAVLQGTTKTPRELLEALWAKCPLLGAFPAAFDSDLINNLTIHNVFLQGLNPYQALNYILDANDLALKYELTSLYTIVKLGEEQAIPDFTNKLKYENSPYISPMTQPEKIAIYSWNHLQGFGQEEDDTRSTNNWLNESLYRQEFNSDIENSKGVKVLWNLDRRLIKEDETVHEESEFTTSLETMKDSYLARIAIEESHKILLGIDIRYMPACKVKAVLFRNWNDDTFQDGMDNPLGGTCTEFITSSEYISMYDSETQTFKAEEIKPQCFREQLYHRNSWVTHTRHTNFVRVGTTSTPSTIKTGDFVSGLGRVFSGTVLKMVNQEWVTGNSCYVFFANDNTVTEGIQFAIEGDIFGDCRLMGTYENLPLYLARHTQSLMIGKTNASCVKNASVGVTRWVLKDTIPEVTAHTYSCFNLFSELDADVWVAFMQCGNKFLIISAECFY